MPKGILSSIAGFVSGGNVETLLASELACVSGTMREACRDAINLCKRLDCQKYSMRQMIERDGDRRLERLLKKTQTLHELCLKGCAVDISGLRAVARNTTLRKLDLGMCDRVWPEDIEAVHWNLPCLQVGLDTQSKLVQSATMQGGTSAVGDGSCLQAMLIQSPALTSLDLSWCRAIEPQALPQESLLGLKDLNLLGCELVNDSICSMLKNVERLNLAFCPVSDEGLLTLARHSASLETLVLADKMNNLWGCGNWTAAGLTAFRSAAPSVRVVLVCS
eukprot:jgi/Tetstr1/447417/TSEL_034851.t1